MTRVVISGKRKACASLQGTRAAQSYSAACGLVRECFLAFEVLVPRYHKCWGLVGFGGFGFVFWCLELCGCLEKSLGDWRKAVSRMAAPGAPFFANVDVPLRGGL